MGREEDGKRRGMGREEAWVERKHRKRRDMGREEAWEERRQNRSQPSPLLPATAGEGTISPDSAGNAGVPPAAL